MAAVKSSRGRRYAERGVAEDEPPDHLETAADLLIKQLVQKQLSTQVSLKQQLQEEKTFERGIGFVPLSDLSAGTNTLQDFERKCQQAEKVQELEGKGLKRVEALAIVAGKQESKASPEVQATKRQFLEPVQIVPQTSQSGYGSIGRQNWELALSEKPGSVESRLYQFATQNALHSPCVESRPSDHPIHQLAAVAHSLTQTADPQRLARTLRRKRRQQVDALSEPQTVRYKAPDKQGTLWDAIERPVEKRKRDVGSPVVTCKKQTLYTVRGGSIVKLNVDSNETIAKPETEQTFKQSGQEFVFLNTPNESTRTIKRLTKDEIKLLPKFQNYEPGNVSKILFIKNLSRHVTETDLSSIFEPFHEPNEAKIIYRLMSGKMKGQAFVTFCSCEKATAALEATNGTVLKDKPIIIQYGRQ